MPSAVCCPRAGWGLPGAQAKSPSALNTAGWARGPIQSSGTSIALRPPHSSEREPLDSRSLSQSWGSWWGEVIPEELLGKQGQEHRSGKCCYRHLCSVVASHWDRGLFNTEDMGGKGSVTVDKGEMKRRNCQKVALAVAAGMGLPIPGSIFFFFAAFIEGGD